MNDVSNAVPLPLQSIDHVRAQFLNLHEFVAVARAKLDRNVWDYLIGGAETETTVRRNRLALDSLAFRPRVLRDVNGTDTGSTFLGRKITMPVALAPIGSIERFDPMACVAVANAAGTFGCPMFQSSVAKPDIEETGRETPGGLKIFQLYVRGDHAWVEAFFDRAMAAGFGALCLTVDTHHYSRRERDISKRYQAASTRDVNAARFQKALDWKQVDKVKARYKLPLVIKGIATAEDAKLAVEHGIDVIYVSNHGGRQLDHGRGSIELLPEVISAARGKAQFVLDSGFMRGTDILKAVARGAAMVGIGKLQALALGAAGEHGVLRMLEILEAELVTSMKLLGASSLDELDGTFVQPAAPVTVPGVLSAMPLLG